MRTYHRSDYFCNQQPIATDGDAGSMPLFAPTYPPKINAMLWQGIRDTLGPAFTAPGVVAGLPYLQVDIEPVTGGLGEPILYFGLGQMHANEPGTYDLLDNQIAPVRGTGTHTLNVTGIAARVAAGDRLALLVYGEHDQYDATGAINIVAPAVVTVTSTGDVYVPIVNNAVTAP